MDKKEILKDISFITTVFNEEKSIILFLNSLIAQTVMPAEIIIVDGGSNDETLKVILEYFMQISKNKPLKMALSSDNEISFKKADTLNGLKELYKPCILEELVFNSFLDCGTEIKVFYADKAKISQGRNIAIRNSRGQIICVSDGGCILKSDWLYEITKCYFQNFNQNIDKGEIGAAGGYNYPYIKNLIQAVLAMCILPKKSEINQRKFMPSSRNISFKRQVWEYAGGYPEYLDYGEDMKFNFNIKMRGYIIKFVPDALVYWNLRDSLKSIFKQFFRYAKGDALGRMYSYRHLVRFFSFFIFLIILVISTVVNPLYLLILVPLLAAYCCKPYSRVSYVLESQDGEFIKNNKSLKVFKILSIFFIPLLLIYIDVAKLSGYIYGLVIRRKAFPFS